jgi:hypothetical protein
MTGEGDECGCGQCKQPAAPTFEQWLAALAPELARVYGMSLAEAERYIRDTEPDSWRDAFEDGITPADAADEEARCAAEGEGP